MLSKPNVKQDFLNVPLPQYTSKLNIPKENQCKEASNTENSKENRGKKNQKSAVPQNLSINEAITQWKVFKKMQTQPIKLYKINIQREIANHNRLLATQF